MRCACTSRISAHKTLPKDLCSNVKLVADADDASSSLRRRRRRSTQKYAKCIEMFTCARRILCASVLAETSREAAGPRVLYMHTYEHCIHRRAFPQRIAFRVRGRI